VRLVVTLEPYYRILTIGERAPPRPLRACKVPDHGLFPRTGRRGTLRSADA
jgi:hypothetical protein